MEIQANYKNKNLFSVPVAIEILLKSKKKDFLMILDDFGLDPADEIYKACFDYNKL